MAILVAVGGAALGSAVGIGWSAGWLVGSIIGSLLFPSTSNSTSEGPRLGDLSVTSSAYGQAIGICYGTVRTAGNVIWSTGLEEVKTTKKTSSGGKGMGGGSSSTAITYSYYCSFAISFCEGEMDDVLRMWCDGKLIYDKTGSGDDITKVDLKFRLYKGTETQNPDSLILADQGIAGTPAFRGLCYIVFERLPLADFGNRIPNVTVELTRNGTAEYPYTIADLFTTAEGGLSSGIQSGPYPDLDRGYFYCHGSGDCIRRFNTRTMKEDRQAVITEDATGNAISSISFLGISTGGYLVISSGGSSNSGPVHLVDPNTLKVISTFGYASGSLDTGPTSFARLAGSIGLVSGTGQQYLLNNSIFGCASVFNISTGKLEYLWDSNTYGGVLGARIYGTCAGAVGETFCEAYYLTGIVYGGGGSDPLYLTKLVIYDNAVYDVTTLSSTGLDTNSLGTYLPGDLIAGETEINKAKGLLYDPTDDTVMFHITGETKGTYLVKVNTTTGEVVWSVATPFGVNVSTGWNYSRISNGIYGYMNYQQAYALYTSSGEIFFQVTSGWSTLAQFGVAGGWWDGNSNTVVGQLASGLGLCKWNFFRGNAGGWGLDDIVSDLCERVALEAADIDVTDLASITVKGYTVSRQSTVRSIVEQLAGIYLFDGIESDYTLKFLLRNGKSSLVTIPQQDLAALSSDSNEFFKETRTQEVELPLRFALTYLNADNDYEQQTHSAKRILNPVPAMSSRNELSQEVPIVMDATTAKQIVETILFSSWIERSTYSLMLPWTYLYLDPADIVTVSLDSGTSFRTRLVQTDVGSDYSIDISAIGEDAAQYTSTTQAYNGEGPLAQEFTSSTITKLILLPTSLLRDSDDSGRTVSRLYFLMGGYGQTGWTSARLFKSAEGTSYDEVGASIYEMTWGTTSNKLGDTDLPFQIDNVNTLTVFLNTNLTTGLSSVTELEMLNGANAAALINEETNVEIIQFQTATQNTDGSYTLSGLLRGRRGTEWTTNLHAVGDLFVLLDTDTVNKMSLSLSELNSLRYYKAVTGGMLFEDSIAQTLASAGNDLKPYAPCHLALSSGSWGSDVVLTWFRRTRVGGGLKDYMGDVPLSEDSEEYEVDILFGDKVIRTIQDIPAETLTYTAAQQATDFPGGYVNVTTEHLVNPGFESGNLEGWTTSYDSNQLIASGTAGVITGPQAGTYWLSFEHGTQSAGATITAYQDIDLSPWIEQILLGNVQARIGAYLASSQTTTTDTGRLDLIWLDSAGSVISTVSSAETTGTGTWTQILTSGTAPVTATSLRIKLVGTCVTTYTINLDWDSVSLEIDEGTKEFLRFKVYQMSAQVGRGFGSKATTVEV